MFSLEKYNYTSDKTLPFITVDPSLPSFEDHPYFQKKAEAAKKLLKKVGLPKELTQKVRGH